MTTAGLRGIDTRDALLVSFFALFIVIARAALRLHLPLPGHSMLPAAFFLVLARACVPRAGAASATGLLAGASAALFGLGRGGPLILLKLALPGLAVDAGAAVGPRLLTKTNAVWGAALLGAAAGASTFFATAAVEALAGMPADLILAHALLAAGAKTVFGALGGAAAGAVVGRLREHGLIGP